MASLSFKFEAKGLNSMNQFLLAMAGKANRPAAVAMTRAARAAEREVKARAPQFIDKPTRYTMNSVFIRPAKPDRLRVEVGFKDWSSQGVPAAEYLQPMAGGGIRKPKPYEQRLRDRRIIGPTQFAVPTGIAPTRLNQFGNLPASTIGQVLSRMRAQREAGSMQNATGSTRSRRKQQQLTYFAAKIGGHLGIYARRAGSRVITPAFWILDRPPQYQATFPVQRMLRETFEANLDQEFERAIADEMAYWVRKGR